MRHSTAPVASDGANGGYRYPDVITPIGSEVFYTAYDAPTNTKIFRTNGTVTSQIVDMFGSQKADFISSAIAANGCWYFVGANEDRPTAVKRIYKFTP